MKDRKKLKKVSPTILHTSPSPQALVIIEPFNLPPGILDILLGLHPHVEDRTVAARADDLVVHAALAALALGPQAGEADLERRNGGELLAVQLGEAGAAGGADGARGGSDSGGMVGSGCGRILGLRGGLGSVRWFWWLFCISSSSSNKRRLAAHA